MFDTRERYAGDVSAGRITDSIHAAGLIRDPAGRALIRLKYANQPEYFNLILYEARTRTKSNINLVRLVLNHYLADVCLTCMGRGITEINSLVVKCEACDGVGKTPLERVIKQSKLREAKKVWDCLMSIEGKATGDMIRALDLNL